MVSGARSKCNNRDSQSMFSEHLQRYRYFLKTIFFQYDRNVDRQQVIDNVSVRVSEISRNWRRLSIYSQGASRTDRIIVIRIFVYWNKMSRTWFVRFVSRSSDDRTERTNPREIAVENRLLIRVRQRNEIEETRGFSKDRVATAL